jgi:hypothetical protein
MDAIGRMGGDGYARTRDYFDLPTLSLAQWERHERAHRKTRSTDDEIPTGTASGRAVTPDTGGGASRQSRFSE